MSQACSFTSFWLELWSYDDSDTTILAIDTELGFQLQTGLGPLPRLGEKKREKQPFNLYAKKGSELAIHRIAKPRHEGGILLTSKKQFELRSCWCLGWFATVDQTH